MNDHRVTYAEVKLAKGSKRPQVKPQEGKSCTTETDQGITYAELNLHKSRGPQENGKSRQCKGSPAPPEKRIAGVLGLTCLVLICVIVSVIVKTVEHESSPSPTEDQITSVEINFENIFQDLQENNKYRSAKLEHLLDTCNCSGLSSREPQCVRVGDKLTYSDSPSPPGMIAVEDLGIVLLPTVVKIIALIACSPAPPEKSIAGVLGLTCLVLICVIVSVIVKTPEYSCSFCPHGWFSYSNSCYYFAGEKKTWNESVTDCQRINSQLLYIDSEEEKDFQGNDKHRPAELKQLLDACSCSGLCNWAPQCERVGDKHIFRCETWSLEYEYAIVI
ncbi:PREDICTED: uncharacterized protein LOC105854393 [Condylura cristata]|uniref:uncharacterized protein LOC105854393 n=1 Tax=Condylura cristata TaxID=143302 RepID=UPI000642A23C|nr:PREDICTED: uncharacterized protein LOC105854393 [Condylura cristata]